MKNSETKLLPEELTVIPLELIRAQKEGKVLFIVGAGVSKQSGLPLFKELVQQVYKELDPPLYEHIINQSNEDLRDSDLLDKGWLPQQINEIKTYFDGEYDVSLGLLEDRLSEGLDTESLVRKEVSRILYSVSTPSSLHKAIIKLSDRGGTTTVVTTNFDLLLQKAAKKENLKLEAYSIGEIMRPSHSEDFSGILHIHGKLDDNQDRYSKLILTDEDFGYYYLRNNSISNFLFDASRLFSLVFIGYRVTDPPVKYLLSAIASDNKNYNDMKRRYIFIGEEKDNPIQKEYLIGRKIIPIFYKTSRSKNGEECHDGLNSLIEGWAKLADRNKNQEELFKQKLKEFIDKPKSQATYNDIENFKLIYELSSKETYLKLAEFMAEREVSYEWIDTLAEMFRKPTVSNEYKYFNQSFIEEFDSYLDEILTRFFYNRAIDISTLFWALKEEKNEKLPKEYSNTKKFLIRNAFNAPYFSSLRSCNQTFKTIFDIIIDGWEFEAQERLFPFTSHVDIETRLKAGENGSRLLNLIITKYGLKYKTLLREDINSEKVLWDASTITGVLNIEVYVSEYNNLDTVTKAIANVKYPLFLVALFERLQRSIDNVFRVLGIIGLEENHFVHYSGDVEKVEYNENDEINAFSKIAVPIKLMHTILTRIEEIDTKSFLKIMKNLHLRDDDISVRLWASVAQKSTFLPIEEIDSFLLRLDPKQFWNIQNYPEIAKLRVVRFGSLEKFTQTFVLDHILELPPRGLFPQGMKADEISKAQHRFAKSELLRIKKENNKLPQKYEDWIIEANKKFAEIENLRKPYNLYFSEDMQTFEFPIEENKLIQLKGEELFNELEKLFKTGSFYDLSYQWVREGVNFKYLIGEMKRHKNTVLLYPIVLMLVYLTHTPHNYPEEETQEESVFEFLFSLLQSIPKKILSRKVDNFCRWLDSWKENLTSASMVFDIWKELYEIIIQEYKEQKDENLLNKNNQRALIDINNISLEIYRSPFATLINIFISLVEKDNAALIPTTHDSSLISMRDQLIDSEDPVKLIAIARMIEKFPLFLNIDEQWALDNLLSPLKEYDERSKLLWVVLSQSPIDYKRLEILGDYILAPIQDLTLALEPRKNLMKSIIYGTLNSYVNEGELNLPIIKNKLIETLRRISDEERVHISDLLQGYLKYYCSSSNEIVANSDTVKYADSVILFIREIWPKEPIFKSKEISSHFAMLPAYAHNRFSEMYETVKRYIVPFECYSMINFGFFLYEENELSVKNLKSTIQTREDALSLLKLIKQSINYESDRRIKPYELEFVLAFIRDDYTELASSVEFKQLASLVNLPID